MIDNVNVSGRATAADDLRRSPRRSCQWPVRVQAPNGRILLQIALNASSDGVMIEADFNPPLHTQLLMKFEAMYQGIVLDFPVRARVAHVVVKKLTFHVGVEFIDPPEKLRAFLAAYSEKKI